MRQIFLTVKVENTPDKPALVHLSEENTYLYYD